MQDTDSAFAYLTVPLLYKRGMASPVCALLHTRACARLDNIKGALCVARVIAQEDLVVWIVPPVCPLREPLIRRIPDFEAAYIL